MLYLLSKILNQFSLKSDELDVLWSLGWGTKCSAKDSIISFSINISASELCSISCKK